MSTQNTQTDTPETSAHFAKIYASYVLHPSTIDLQDAEKFAIRLERERDEWQRTARSYGKKIEAMREAVKEAHGQLEEYLHYLRSTDSWTNDCKAALANDASRSSK